MHMYTTYLKLDIQAQPDAYYSILKIAKLSLPAFKGWVALSSLVRSSVDRHPSRIGDLSTIFTVWCFRPYKPYVHFPKALGPRISKLILSSVSWKNTQIQRHKYTNTAYDKVPERPNMWHIFEKRIVQRYQKWYANVSKEDCSRVSKTQPFSSH